jgi:2-polyprenyl-3-methyl-5-hydroxy-6-metoxy-1,4-benzoquinol methylase
METPFELIDINPGFFHTKNPKPIVCEEGTGTYYEHDIEAFFETLQMMERGKVDIERTPYFNKWGYKGTEVRTRLGRLPDLVKSIREEGIKEPVSCEVTGERLDGSFRTKIAIFLGIPSVKAKLYRFNWRNISEDFIERKLKARNLSVPKDYYEFSYGHKDWKNIESGGEVYRENADRVLDILHLVEGKTVLDVGCNEGYIGLQLARLGKKVEGIDLEWTNIAYLNKLIFEYVDKKDLAIEFFEEDLLNTKRIADTILMLNVLYHIPKDKQAEFVSRFKGKQMIFQCNLRKEKERDHYYTSHPDDLLELLTRVGLQGRVIKWRDKPLIVV